jgi:hypothetical protein
MIVKMSTSLQIEAAVENVGLGGIASVFLSS